MIVDTRKTEQEAWDCIPANATFSSVARDGLNDNYIFMYEADSAPIDYDELRKEQEVV